jgi:hypothetical protein
MEDESGQSSSADGSPRPIEIEATEWGEKVRRLSEEQKFAEQYGTVVIWHRWIDANLEQAIRANFEEHTKGHADSLLKYPGGLSSFSARAHLGRCMGLYGPITYTDINTINNIRNEFSHPRDDESGFLEILGFGNSRIKESCDKLRFLEHSSLRSQFQDCPMSTPRGIYASTASAIAFALWMCHLMGKLIPGAKGSMQNAAEYLP